MGACARFDATLAHVRTYVHFFCNCGVRIDSQALSDLIARLTLTYDSLSLQVAANETFRDVDVVVDGSAAWLYQLRWWSPPPPFGTAPDILYVYRFAEGDSTILQNKMARDTLKGVSSFTGICMELLALPFKALLDRNGIGAVRVVLSVELLRVAGAMLFKNKKKQTTEWFDSHARIERIAKLHAMITIYDTVCKREGLRGSKELELFKNVHIDSLV